ncbi:MAG: hypothetical protein HYZ16_02195 [Bacteroidetes bacterium]|nr:hypothetical protein [Bacteroidota bacterium]
MNTKLILFACATLLVLSGCATTRVVAPLPKGEWRAGVDGGGPLVNNAVLPLLGLHSAYGIKDNLTIFSGLQITSLAFQTLHMDLGACKGLYKPAHWRPGLSLSGVLNPLVSLRDGSWRIYPELNPTAYWKVASKHLLYVGLPQWFDPWKNSVEIGKGHFWHPSAQLGFRFEFSKWALAAEYKLLNINKKLTVPQATVNNWTGSGAQGLYLSIQLRLSNAKKNE